MIRSVPQTKAVNTLKPIVNCALIVDDSDDDRYLLKRLLGRSKVAARVAEAVHGQAALDHLASIDPQELGSLPSVIFIDINMPIMGGFEFLDAFAKLRARIPELQAVVLAMFSSSDHHDDHARAESYPFVKGYIVKMPSSADELRRTVQDCLSKET